MSFQIHALPAEPFQPLFDLSETELAKHRAKRVTVCENPGSPCRVSMEDIPVGEEAILLNYEHQSANSPFRSSHAIFVRQGAEQAKPEINEVPALLRHRLISLRAFDSNHMLVDADAVEGTQLEAAIGASFGSPQTAYLHLHYATAGCFAASVTRAG